MSEQGNTPENPYKSIYDRLIEVRAERDRLAARVAELEAELAAVRAAVTKAAMTPSGRAATYIAQALEALGMGLHPRGQVADREMRRAAESPDRSEQ